MDTDLIYFCWPGGPKNWFKEQYFAAGGNSRYWTFASALNLLNQRIDNPVIIETGCQRLEGDFGGGMSTSIFAEYISRYGGELISIDNNKRHLDMCKPLLKKWPNINCTLVHSDSVKWLNDFQGKCDFVYLDSYDFPFGTMLDKYGGKVDIEKAIETVMNLPLETILNEFGDIILPCQEHCLNEFKAIESNLADNAIVLIDDNNFPAEGKSRLAKKYLQEQGWFCISDGQQTLWMRKF